MRKIRLTVARGLSCFLALTSVVFANSNSALADNRFDNIDVLNYHIHLDISDLSSKSILGYTDVRCVVEKASDSIVLYLEGLKVDSVAVNGASVSFQHAGKVLQIASSDADVGDTLILRVYYGGKPIRDASWGGFYFSGEYAYNMGVAFTSSPHNYGRCWFPCVDNFTDKALYAFSITTSTSHRAMCNGTLVDSAYNSTTGKITWEWKLSSPISTYLASVAVAPYTVRQFSHNSIPIMLSAVLGDSMDMEASFKNLTAAIDAFEKRYGEHRFERIGFNLVPFNAGAMEHATNIAYPRYASDGGLAFETLFAHELAHHWWGDAITCETAEDMWLNEGWASYSERIFLEEVYGHDRYLEDISSNHRAVLHYAHLRDGDTLSVSGVSHENTYGMHVYDKGADVIHTLRGYMGDSAFFAATSSFIDGHLYGNVNSADLKNHFQKFTKVNLQSFFNDWIYGPGFPAFDVIDWRVEPDGDKFINSITLRQRVRFAPDYFDEVPIDLQLISTDFKTTTIRTSASGYKTELVFETDYQPSLVWIDPYERISDAVTDKFHVIKDTGTYDFADAMMEVKVTESSDSSWMRVEHYWVAPDAWFNNADNPFLSRERYWSVSGIWNEGLKASATIEYNGRNAGGNYAAGYFDNDLIRLREDSLVLMFRPTNSSPWAEHPDYTVNMRSPFDKIGSIDIHRLMKGEYALAMKDQQLLSDRGILQTISKDFLTISPNPGRGAINFAISGAKDACLEITNSSGQVILKKKIKGSEKNLKIDTSSWGRGVYYAGIVIDNRPYTPKLFIVR